MSILSSKKPDGDLATATAALNEAKRMRDAPTNEENIQTQVNMIITAVAALIAAFETSRPK